MTQTHFINNHLPVGRNEEFIFFLNAIGPKYQKKKRSTTKLLGGNFP